MANRLAQETSPYLQQHADNPVDWYPWGEEALTRAQREDKPILLSIGYSACHWCHVMAHESFEDPQVAAVMNDLFVNIKVDREERPDLDQVYQLAQALLTRRSGGWPLTMVLTPSGEPFFGGTYFPKEGRYGLPGFKNLLPRVAAAYRDQKGPIAEQNQRLKDALASLAPVPGDQTLPIAAPAAALKGLKRTFDDQNGGFGGAPKFPHPTELALCLRAFGTQGDSDALHMIDLTLAHMAAGGIHDQLGGGFCRYSVDAEWSIPHFEKMLYDNGPLLGLFADAARITGERVQSPPPGRPQEGLLPLGGTARSAKGAQHMEAARGIVGWLAREMRAPDGAFYSSVDADSEGHEGKFYVWTPAEVERVLSPDEFAVAAPYFGLDGPPNFEHEAWHLRVVTPLATVAERLRITLPDAQMRLVSAKGALFAARAQRIRPALDDKILTSWNALAIAGLARAARVMDEPKWADMAVTATDALHRTAWKNGRLLATRKGDHAHLNAYLDDYAFLLSALLELMQTRFRLQDYTWARELADVLLAWFEDLAQGGFWFTSHDHEVLLQRQKPGADNATPSGNGVAATALLALGRLAAETRYVEAAERAVRAFAESMRQSPGGYSTLLDALEEIERPPGSVLLAGEPNLCADWQRALETRYRPGVRIINTAGSTPPTELVKGPSPSPGSAAAWICRGTHCLPPVSTLAEIEVALAAD